MYAKQSSCVHDGDRKKKTQGHDASLQKLSRLQVPITVLQALTVKSDPKACVELEREVQPSGIREHQLMRVQE